MAAGLSGAGAETKQSGPGNVPGPRHSGRAAMPPSYPRARRLRVYATAEDAESARLRVRSRPGFSDSPEGFEVSRYTVGQDHWTEGYVSWAKALGEPGEGDA